MKRLWHVLFPHPEQPAPPPIGIIEAQPLADPVQRATEILRECQTAAQFAGDEFQLIAIDDVGLQMVLIDKRAQRTPPLLPGGIFELTRITKHQPGPLTISAFEGKWLVESVSKDGRRALVRRP